MPRKIAGTAKAPGCKGTNTTYVAGCRCDKCRTAHNAYIRDYRARKQAAGKKDPDLIPHGTHHGYVDYGCRCPECSEHHRATYADYHREYRRENADRINANQRRHAKRRRDTAAAEYEKKRQRRLKK